MPPTIAICIPRVPESVSRDWIFRVFCKLDVGFIENISEIRLPNGTGQKDVGNKRILLQIRWNQSSNAKYFLSRFAENKSVKVVHDLPWYWICLPNYPAAANHFPVDDGQIWKRKGKREDGDNRLWKRKKEEGEEEEEPWKRRSVYLSSSSMKDGKEDA
jgi:hypothetical protein